MDKAEARHVSEINRLKEACGKTKSDYLRRDYQKAITRMERELKEYRNYKHPKN